jgi:hypothetical protein
MRPIAREEGCDCWRPLDALIGVIDAIAFQTIILAFEPG